MSNAGAFGVFVKVREKTRKKKKKRKNDRREKIWK